MLIFPAIDLLDGKCVRLTKGNFGESKTYHDDPLEMALSFQSAGAEWLHVVDLDAARTGEPKNLATIARIVTGTRLKLQVGGGIRSLESAFNMLSIGVDRIVMGSQLAKDLDFARTSFDHFGERVVAGIDVSGGKVAVHGWQESSEWSAEGLAKALSDAGCQRIIATEISRDGMLSGPDKGLYEGLMSAVDIPVIASGGVSSLQDLLELKSIGVEGAITGKALYESRFTLEQALCTGTH